MKMLEITPEESSNIERARRYLAAIEAGATAEAMGAFFDPAVEQTEFPNRFVPAGATRDLAALLAAAVRGRTAVRDQRYEVRSVIARGDRVALEVGWSATLNVPLGTSPAGGVLRADFAVFLQFKEGRLVSQHNYDCFHPF